MALLWLATVGLFLLHDVLRLTGMGATAGAVWWMGVILFVVAASVTWAAVAYAD